METESTASPDFYRSETPQYGMCTDDTVTLIYFINNEEEKKGRLKLLNLNQNYDNILYNEIAYSFYYFLKEIEDNKDDNNKKFFIDLEQEEFNPIDICYIRFFDGDGWILLEEDDAIVFNEKLNINNIKFMIKANIYSEEKRKLLNNCLDINNQIKNIQNDLLGNLNNYIPDSPQNLIVLTANPLMNGENELRTMNDFNIIPATIYKLLEKEDYLKYTEFLPLTMNTLKSILSDENRRPVILHLICKSIYILENIKDESAKCSELFTNLIFEDDKNKINCNLEFINKKKLENEFNSDEIIKKNIEKITLIISTPLAEDVYDIFKDFGFKNLLVQHTTLADVNFIADFNYKFYEEIILKHSLRINDLYKIAFNIYTEKMNPPCFCCCFHKHKNNCTLMQYMKNELYNDNRKIDIDKLLPHFNHLYPYDDCYSQSIKSKYPIYSFSFHHKGCLNDLGFKNKDKKRYYDLCCCEVKPEYHNKNNIFFKDFQNKNNIIGFRMPEMKIKNKFPNYDTMKLLVGQNEIISNAIKFINSQESFFDIIIDDKKNLKFLENIIIEYYKEKNYQLYDPEYSEDKNINLNKTIKRINSTSDIGSNKVFFDLSDDKIFLKSKKSNPIIPKVLNPKKYDFEELELNNNLNLDKFNDNNNNKIYFIFVEDINSMKEIKQKISKNKNKIIWLYIDKNKNKKFEYEHELNEQMYEMYFDKNKKNPFPNLYIQFQNNKKLRINWRKNNQYKLSD